MNSLITPEIANMVPSTRYQGSKRRILYWLYENLRDLNFHSVLDGFGGTGSVSYLFKLMGKKVTFNDLLLSNYQTGIAFIENSSIKLNKNDVEFLLNDNRFIYPTFIQDTYKDIYYFKNENKWLDIVNFNIKMLSKIYSGKTLKIKKALAYHALFQACLSKRPFNTFHRKNLNLRNANVKRSFGNKTTWDTNFSLLFKKFSKETSDKVFSNELNNKVTCKDIMEIKNENYDLVYLDPPYTRPNDKHPKDYFGFYHFMEGLVNYDVWFKNIDWTKKNIPLVKKENEWEKNTIKENFKNIFEEFQDSIIIISYGNPGNPSIEEIKKILQHYKSKVNIFQKEYAYKLNRKNGKNMYEALIIGN